jgi:hypothetical protein
MPGRPAIPDVLKPLPCDLLNKAEQTKRAVLKAIRAAHSNPIFDINSGQLVNQ